MLFRSALVSNQRMQNVIPVLQIGSDFDKVWLVRSTDADLPNSRFALAWQDTENTLRTELKLEVHSAEPSVGAYGIAETQRLITDLINKESQDNIVVNFTGGTKCMSVGAYLAAQNTHMAALYVDTANEKLVWFSGEQRQEEKFNLTGKLTVPVYFRANGKQIAIKRTQQYILSEEAYAAARELATVWPQCLNKIGRASCRERV